MARTQVIGTDGNDKLRDGQFGNSDIFAKKGNDIIKLLRDDDFGGNNFVNAGPGNDQVINHKEFANTILLGPGKDIYAADGFAFDIERGDIVRGGDGDDIIAVSTFHSLYEGNKGNDFFASIGWQNTFKGGIGNDTLSYELRHTDNVIGDTGVNIDMAVGKAFTGTIRTEFFSGIENIRGSIHRDEIFGNAQANVINSLGGNDAVDADAGNDTLIGGSGPDFLVGNKGADKFVYTAASDSPANSFDIIDDFSHAEGDKIVLKGVDANKNAAGIQKFIFIGDQPFTGVAGQLHFVDGELSADLTGSGVAAFVIQLTDVPQLVAGDLSL